MREAVTLLALVACAHSTAACAHVAPYDRGPLAHPSMTSDPTPLAAEHMVRIHEGATGGKAPAASGCGCN